MTGVVLAAGAMFAVGLIDDVRDMSAPAKMAGQVLAASILYFSGVTMYELKIPLAGFFVLTPGIIPLITAIWVIALTNAVNLIDGLDGLAAGVVAIGGGALALYGIRLMGLGLLPSDNIGAAGGRDRLRDLPRLPALQLQPRPHLHGRRRRALPRAADGRVDHGDRRPRPRRPCPISGVTYFFFAPLFIPMLILGVPLVDMAFAFVRRTASGPGVRHPRQGAHPPPPAPPGPRPASQRHHPVGVDGDPLELPALPALRPPGQRLHPDRCGGPGRGPLHVLPPRSATGQRRRGGRAPPTREFQVLPGRRNRPQRGGPVPFVTVWTRNGPGCDDEACVPRPPRLVRCCPPRPRGRRTPARHAPHKGRSSRMRGQVERRRARPVG